MRSSDPTGSPSPITSAPARRPSMADVAREAGVSSQTVSRVVNDSPRVDPETRRRVLEAMSGLGFTINRAARALRTGRTHTIGVVVATLASVGNSRMLEAVTEAAAARDYAVTVLPIEHRRAVARTFSRLGELGVDGVIMLNEATALAEGTSSRLAVPLVAVDSPGSEAFATVRSDHAGGAAEATSRLLRAGHRTVHHLAGPESSYAAAERVRGWRSALEAAGAEVPDVARGDWTSAAGYAAGIVWASRCEVSAVFAANDQMALGLLRAFADAGRPAPTGVSVIGFDDVIDAAEFQPPLTTVRQNFQRLGESAVSALLDTIAGASPAQVVVPATLVERSSARAPE